MADISMCSDSNCPLKDNCYRQKAPKSDLQCYADFNYDNGCSYYWKY
jgi:hypothetical protein